MAYNPAARGGSFQVYVDQMFNLGGAAVTTLTNMNSRVSADGSGSYSPRADGTLKAIVIQVSGQAASSLAQSGYITLSCTMWAPVNTLTIPFTGFGLLTAPQLLGGNLELEAWPGLDLPVKTSVPVTGQVIYFFSPVTPNITVAGIFGAKMVTAA